MRDESHRLLLGLTDEARTTRQRCWAPLRSKNAYRQVGGLGALQDAVHVAGGTLEEVGHARDRLAQDLQPLAPEVRAENGIAGDVAARPGEARYQAGAHRIADANHHDQDGRGCCLGRLRRRGAEGRDQVDRTPIPCWTL